MLDTVGILDMAIDALEKGFVDEALLHMHHARIHARKDANKLKQLDKLQADMSWINNPDRMGQ